MPVEFPAAIPAHPQPRPGLALKKTVAAMALGGAVSAACAQSSLVVYGVVDAGVGKLNGSSLTLGKRDNNRLGFRGVEDLGGGLKALFQLEIRFEPDTGTIESTSGPNSRPFFQGQSRVGLQGDFGTVRLGRGLPAYQETSAQFEPWYGIPAVAGFQPDMQVAGYTADPLSPPGNSRNRFSNAVFYNTPVFAGIFQLNATVAAKEANGNAPIIGRGTAAAPQFPANSVPITTPFSLSATAINGAFGAYAGYERNAIATKLWSVGTYVKPVAALKLMATYQQQDQTENVLINPKTRAWVLGANYAVRSGRVLLGYGQKTPDNVLDNPALGKTRQTSAGYEHNLSTRTFLYIDVSTRRAATSANYVGVGIQHTF
jgi:predicted porin